MSTSHNIIEKIKNDLRFIVLEPNLNLYSDAFKGNNYFAALATDLKKVLSRIPDDRLIEIISAYEQHYRLGIYAERLLELYFQYSDRYELIEANTQIIIDKKTVGEIDYIVFDKEECILKHIELACKFYIQMGPSAKLWVGPNPKDNLAKKSSKLIKQLDLSQKNHPILQKIKDDYSSDFHREAWIKGRLFGINNELPDGSKHISCGKIFKSSKLGEYWIPVQKIEWLSNFEDHKLNHASPWDHAQMLINKNNGERAFYLSERWLGDYQHSIL